MSVWPALASSPSLSGRDGALIWVSIDVNPRYLEDLLEALARVGFPINPQIYHDAEMVYMHADGHEETASTTLVEFPAYAGRLEEVSKELEADGFDPASVYVTGILDQIHRGSGTELAPPKAGYLSRYRRKRADFDRAHKGGVQ